MVLVWAACCGVKGFRREMDIIEIPIFDHQSCRIQNQAQKDAKRTGGSKSEEWESLLTNGCNFMGFSILVLYMVP